MASANVNSIEIVIGGQKYVLKGEETVEHLREVADLVKRKIEVIRKKNSTLSIQKATMLAAFDLASGSIKGRKKALDYRSSLVSKANRLLEKMQTDLTKNEAKPLC